MLPKGYVQLYTAEKPVNRLGWWKESLLYFRCQQVWGGWQTSVQRPTPPPPPLRIGNQRAGAFIARSGEGATCRNSTFSSDSHLQIGHQGSAQHYVGYLGTVILQFQGPLVPIFCSQFSELWQLMSWVQSGHHVVNLSTSCFSIYETAHRVWLRILSIALEKELKVLDYC